MKTNSSFRIFKLSTLVPLGIAAIAALVTQPTLADVSRPHAQLVLTENSPTSLTAQYTLANGSTGAVTVSQMAPDTWAVRVFFASFPSNLSVNWTEPEGEAGKVNNISQFFVGDIIIPGDTLVFQSGILGTGVPNGSTVMSLGTETAGAPIDITVVDNAADFEGHPVDNDDTNGFLPNQMIVSTVPANGDLNPYGVAFVPPGFQAGNGPLLPGDILVSNFNNSKNLQGTGTTIVRVSTKGVVSKFFRATPAAPGAIGNGLSTALAVLRKGVVIVGSVPSVDGTAKTVGPGGLLVINSAGNLVQTISDSNIKGPWDMTVVDEGNQAIAFVSNVLNGTILRLNLNVATSGVTVTGETVIASGYKHRGDPAAFEVGPTGLVYNPQQDVLYVASTEDNAVFALQQAAKRTFSGGTGTVIYKDAIHLHGPLGMIEAPNGHLLAANSDVINPNPAQPSEIDEFTKQGQFIKQLSVDPAFGGSFGLAVRGTEESAFFAAVDDNTATLTIWNIR